MLLIRDFFSISANIGYFPVFLSEETASSELPPGALKPENIPAFFKYESSFFPCIRIQRNFLLLKTS